VRITQLNLKLKGKESTDLET